MKCDYTDATQSSPVVVTQTGSNQIADVAAVVAPAAAAAAVAAPATCCWLLAASAPSLSSLLPMCTTDVAPYPDSNTFVLGFCVLIAKR